MTYITRIANKRILAKYFLYSLQINYLHWKLSASRSIFSCYATYLLSPPQFDRMFILDTDASNEGVGAVLSQVGEDGREQVVAYGSRLLTKAERKYCVTRKELLAVVTFTKKFRPYLLGKKFLLRTDHGSLVWLTNFKDPQGQLARWLEILQEFSFEVQHRRGSKHTNADALSRLPCSQCGRSQLTEEAPPIGITSLVPQDSGEMRGTAQ